MMPMANFQNSSSRGGNGNKGSVLAHPARGACHGSDGSDFAKNRPAFTPSHGGNGNKGSVLSHPARGACHGSDSVNQFTYNASLGNILDRFLKPRSFNLMQTFFSATDRRYCPSSGEMLNKHSILDRSVKKYNGLGTKHSRLFGGAICKILMVLILAVSVQGTRIQILKKGTVEKVTVDADGTLKKLLDTFATGYSVNRDGTVEVEDPYALKLQPAFADVYEYKPIPAKAEKTERRPSNSSTFNNALENTPEDGEELEDVPAQTGQTGSSGRQVKKQARKPQLGEGQGDSYTKENIHNMGTEKLKEEDGHCKHPSLENGETLRSETNRSFARAHSEDAAYLDFLESEKEKRNAPLCSFKKTKIVWMKRNQHIICVRMKHNKADKAELKSDVDRIIAEISYNLSTHDVYVTKNDEESDNLETVCGNADEIYDIHFEQWFALKPASTTRHDRDDSEREEEKNNEREMNKHFVKAFKELRKVYEDKYQDCCEQSWERGCFNKACFAAGCTAKSTIISVCVSIYGLCMAVVGGCLPTFIQWIQVNVDARPTTTTPGYLKGMIKGISEGKQDTLSDLLLTWKLNTTFDEDGGIFKVKGSPDQLEEALKFLKSDTTYLSEDANIQKIGDFTHVVPITKTVDGTTVAEIVGEGNDANGLTLTGDLLDNYTNAVAVRKAGNSFKTLAEELGYKVPDFKLTKIEDGYTELIDSDNWAQLVAFVIALSIMSAVHLYCCIKKPFECDI